MSKTKPKTTPKPAEKTEDELFADTNVTMKSGHTTRDAETIADGKFAKIRIASNKEYLTKDGQLKTITNFFNILVSSNLKEAFPVAKDLKKGDWAYFKGEDSTKSVDTPEGYKELANTIFAYKVVLKKKKAETANNTETTTQPDKENPALNMVS